MSTNHLYPKSFCRPCSIPHLNYTLVFHVFFWTSSFPQKNDATQNNQPAWMTLLVARKPATPGIQTMVAQQTYRSSWDSISSCFGAMGTSVELGNMTFIHYTNFTWKMMNPVEKRIFRTWKETMIFRGELFFWGKGIQSLCKWSFFALCEVFQEFLFESSCFIFHVTWKMKLEMIIFLNSSWDSSFSGSGSLWFSRLWNAHLLRLWSPPASPYCQNVLQQIFWGLEFKPCQETNPWFVENLYLAAPKHIQITSVKL